MEWSRTRVLKSASCIGLLLGSAALVGAQSPTLPPKVEKPEPAFHFESRKSEEVRRTEDARREAAAAKAASSGKKSSSSKSRSVEIRGLTFGDDSARGNRPLIIKSGKMEAKAREQLKEDLLVMCRIIEKASREHINDVHKAAGIDLLALGGGNRSVRTMYLDDYGAIFTLNVRLPLRNEVKSEEQDTKEPALNEEWEETRNELFGQKRKSKRSVIAQGPAYDAGDVEQFKTELIDAVRNAANIRNMKPNDWVVVAVSGPTRFEGEVLEVQTGRGEDARNVIVPQFEGFENFERGVEDSTMLLKVKKAHLEDVVRKGGTQEEVAKELEKVISVQVY
jgi:hypothetical protein